MKKRAPQWQQKGFVTKRAERPAAPPKPDPAPEPKPKPARPLPPPECDAVLAAAPQSGP